MKKKGELKKDRFTKNSKAQVWVETVIYLLIAFVMMGLVLSFVKPKIEELRDKSVVEQSVEIIKEIENSMVTIGSPGNKRLIEVGIKKGSLTIDSENDKIFFEMDTNYAYGEVGEEIYIGNIKATTEGEGRTKTVTLERDFSGEGYDITYNQQTSSKVLTKSPNSYKLFMENRGDSPLSPGDINIDFDIE